MLKIISWNIRQGGGTRITKLISKLAEQASDIIVLSEFRNNHSGQKIRAALLQSGYRFQAVTQAQRDVNSAAIFSKLPGNVTLYPQSDPTYAHNILSMTFEAFTVYGMYLPHKKKHILFDLLIQEAQMDHPGIMVGDMNSGKNGIDQKGNSFWYEDKLMQLEKNGYIDAFRAMKGQVAEFSWFSHQGNGYRYDHTYIDDSLLPIVKDCYYLHEWRISGLSDHSPMVLELG